MSVRKNIEYGLKLKKLPIDEIRRRTVEVIEITALGGYEDRLPGQLSGGQQQRVALARALAIRPNVLLLDEPLSNLDAKLRLEMRDNISRIHRQTGITTVYVTHDQKEALSMGTEVSVMRAGLLEQTDSPRTLYHHPRSSFIASFIGETNLVSGEVTSIDGGVVNLKSDIGTLKSLHNPLELGAGDRAHISIRPEALQVRFEEPGARAENILRPTLEKMVYLGESEQFLFKCEDGTALKANIFHTPEQHGLKEGRQVECSIKAADILVLPYQSTSSDT